jgi:serine/threonine protein kinase
MYTPGYAPPEQYHGRERLGPWSDIYAVGATIHACLSGMAPQPADRRLQEDLYESATRLWAGKYSRHLLETIDWCLELDHLRRPQSVFVLQKVLLREKDPVVHDRSRLFGGVRGRWLRFAGL